ncbi:MAG TPA: acyl-protein synthetase [Nitrospiraceae bacterium]|nr:acyl-protein synthetase [Nitrospiraceae bacterium]
MKDYSPDKNALRELDRDVTAFVNRGIRNADEEQFNALALKGFAYQYATIGQYRAYCDKAKTTPDTLTRWEEIPTVPSFAFTKLLRSAFSAQGAEAMTLRSGVAELKRKRRPVYPDAGAVQVMEEANDLLAKAYLFPDVERMKMLFLVPPPAMAPGMVMAKGLEHMKEQFGTPDSGFLISFRGLKLKTLITALKVAETSGQPLAIIGATMVLDYFLRACEGERVRFRLPPGSRVCDSGGYAGRYTKVSPEEFPARCRKILGIDEPFCVNALWLCENSTVYYDHVLNSALSGAQRPRYKDIPPWCRVVAVNPWDFRPLPKGEAGLLRHYDLTNRAMAFGVQTDKLGFETGEGFEVIGKWGRHIGKAAVDHAAAHPGGRLVTKLMDFVMRRKMSRVGRLAALSA